MGKIKEFQKKMIRSHTICIAKISKFNMLCRTISTNGSQSLKKVELVIIESV